MAGVKGRSGGHNRKPTHLKLVQGSLDKNPQRANAKEPRVVDSKKLRSPSWAGKVTRKWFRYFEKQVRDLKVLSATDESALLTIAQAAAEVEITTRVIEQKGLTYETVDQVGNTIIRLRPEVTKRERARKELVRMYALFGLSPADRARVQVADKPEDPFQAFLDGKAG